MGEFQKRIMQELDENFYYSVMKGKKTFNVTKRKYVEARIKDVVEDAKKEFPRDYQVVLTMKNEEVLEAVLLQKIKDWFVRWFE